MEYLFIEGRGGQTRRRREHRAEIWDATPAAHPELESWKESAARHDLLPFFVDLPAKAAIGSMLHAGPREI
jgi:hypothetical protein